MKYCIYITYQTPKGLHQAHKNIKALDFILGKPVDTLEQAHINAVNYINDCPLTQENTSLVGHEVPITPTTYKEWKHLPNGFHCTEEPCKWKLTVWHKKQIKGYLFNTFKVNEIFHIDILQVFQHIEDEEPDPYPTIIQSFTSDESDDDFGAAITV